MFKLLTLREEDDPRNLIQVVRRGAFEKTAGSTQPQIQQWLDEAKPVPGHTQVLVCAMGAGEYYGPNSNADYFSEASLIHTPENWMNMPYEEQLQAGASWAAQGGYGYPTFYGAYPFQHHQNKDPNKAFGKVVMSAWNPVMKRVELVIDLDHELCRRFGAISIVDRVEHGEKPAVSMGCRVKYDLCRHCLDKEKYRHAESLFDPSRHPAPDYAVLEYHLKDPISGLARTRAEYCQAMLTQRNKILENGVKVCVENPYPRFFDISFVLIGADKIARTMMKVASGTAYSFPTSAEEAEKLGWKEDTVTDCGSACQLGIAAMQEPIMSKVASLDPQQVIELAGMAKQANGDMMAHLIKTPAKDHREGCDCYKCKPKQAELKRADIVKHVAAPMFDRAAELAAAEPDIPDETLDQMGETGDLSTPSSLGMVLKPHEFQRVALKGMGLGNLADVLSQAGKVFAMGSGVPAPAPNLSCGCDHGIKSQLMPMFQDRSVFAPPFRRRMVRITITKMLPPEPISPEPICHPVLNKVAGMYTAYRNALIREFPDMAKRAMDDSSLTSELFGDDVLGAGFLGVKTAGPDTWKALTAIFPAMYLYSAHLQAKLDKGEELGLLDRVIANNPMVSASFAAGGLKMLMEHGAKAPVPA